MSGPLRRLARQAAGAKTLRVHTTARLPYAPAPELLTDTSSQSAPERLADTPPEPASAPLPESQAREPREDTPDRPASGPEPQPVSHQSPTADVQVVESVPPAELATPPTPAHALLDPAPVDVPGTTGRYTLEPPEGSTKHATPPPRSTPATRFAGRAAANSLDSYGDEPKPLVEFAPPAVPENTGPEPAPRRDNEPETLVPAHQALRHEDPPPTGRIRPGSISVPHPAQRPPAKAAPADEIHVHIGRIEVTAVQEPAPPAPGRKRKGREPMSLDDYLAKRRQTK